MLTSIVVDDEEDGRELIVDYVTQTSFLELKADFSSPIEALDFVKNYPIDVVFLDVEMPFMTGIEFAKLLDELYAPYQGPYIIFSTAYRDYAVDSYDFHRSIGYLMKPSTYSRFLKFAQKLERLIGK